MNKEEQIQAYEQIQDYLQMNHVHGIFSQLVQQVILEKPANLLDFLIEHLQQPEKFTLFVVGPPGLSLNTTIRKALATSSKDYELFNFGEELTAIEKLLDESEKAKMKSCKLVGVDAIASIINKMEKKVKQSKNYIIEGYPKSLNQALILQRRGICAKNVLVINVSIQSLQQLCEAKISSVQPELEQSEKDRLVGEAILEHHILMKEVKQFYKHYMEIDLSNSQEEEFVIKQLNKAFNLKTIQPVPRVTSQLLIVGAPFSGRTTLGKKIANHYGLVYISTSFLIAEEIRKDTIHGRKARGQYIGNKLVDSFLIEKLIEQRIGKKDCRMQGFVLEGYPKTIQQFQNIKNMKLDLTMMVAIDTPQAISESRSTTSPETLSQRINNWKVIADHLRESQQQIFWADSSLSVGNLYEEVVYELEKQLL